MSLSAPARWLITYDIANPRRLVRVFQLLKRHGVPVQYSVFQVEASAAQIGQLMAQVAARIHKREDDVRAYRIPERGWRATLGATMLPEDVLVAPAE